MKKTLLIATLATCAFSTHALYANPQTFTNIAAPSSLSCYSEKCSGYDSDFYKVTKLPSQAGLETYTLSSAGLSISDSGTPTITYTYGDPPAGHGAEIQVIVPKVFAYLPAPQSQKAGSESLWSTNTSSPGLGCNSNNPNNCEWVKYSN